MARRTTAKRLIHVTGLEDIQSVLMQIPEDLRTNITAKVVKAGGRPVVVAMKRFAKRSERTGALREAIGSVTRKYERTATAVEICGVRRGYYRGRARLGKNDDRRGSESPSHYAHLVEFGHNQATGGSLRGKYSMKLVGIGKFSHKGNELKRWKKDQLVEEAKGRVVRWVPPKPFIRPAFATMKTVVLREMVKALDNSLKSTRRRLVKKGWHTKGA